MCGMESHSIGFRPSYPVRPVSPSLVSVSLFSSMWWTVLRFGGGGLVSWLPRQLQQSTDVSILCGGSQGLW